jgi:glycosyltransferase involved in cell wall biosynthesis
MDTESSPHQALPSLTVVIPNYNHGHLIGDQLQAILHQSTQPLKIIIIDDASTDDSVSTIEQLIFGHQNVEFIRRKANSGSLVLVNDILEATRSTYVTFLAADDVVLPGFIEKSLRLLARHPEAALCSAVSLVRGRDSERLIPNRTAYPCTSAGFVAPMRAREVLLRSGNWYIGTTAIFRLEALKECGGFDVELKSFADEFVSYVLALRHGACFIPEVLAINRVSEGSYSASISRDEDEIDQILVRSSLRMTNDYAKLFPKELVSRINARLAFSALQSKLGNIEARVRGLVEAARPMNGRTCLLVLVQGAMRGLELLLFCVLRFHDIPRVIRSRLWCNRVPR